MVIMINGMRTLDLHGFHAVVYAKYLGWKFFQRNQRNLFRVSLFGRHGSTRQQMPQQQRRHRYISRKKPEPPVCVGIASVWVVPSELYPSALVVVFRSSPLGDMGPDEVLQIFSGSLHIHTHIRPQEDIVPLTKPQ